MLTTSAPRGLYGFRIGCIAAAIAFGVVGCGGNDDGSAPVATGPTEALSIAPKIPCESFVGKTYENVTVTAATKIAASGAIPAYCKVSGTEAGTQHDIEVRLPDAWTRRLVQEGGGGFDGSIPNVSVNGANVSLTAGATQVANNGGHRDPSGNVLLNNPLVVQRYAHTAIAKANSFAKDVTAAYFGEAPRYSYYEGCSNGGRGALNAAAKYGSQFDGVIAGAPTRNLTGQIEQWTRAAALTLPSVGKLNLIAAAAVAKCDALDGVSDGVVSNWSMCTFDPTTDVPASVGLTAAEASSVKTLMTDLNLASGTTIYSGYGVGSMAQWGPAYASLGIGHMRNIVLNDPNWPVSTFNVDTYFPIIGNVIDGMYQFNASVGGLTQFMAAGKKVMIWQGSDDALLSHKDTIRTWKEVTDAAGDAVAQANSRLYIAAGVNHCGGGPGADRFDLLTPMMAWVEKGTVPGTPIATKVNGTTAAFTRPLCVNPLIPRYRGTGDVNSADSYTCAAA